MQFQDFLRGRVSDLAKGRGLEVIDVAEEMRRREPKGKWFYPEDGHFTPAGHRVVAAIMAGRLVGSGSWKQGTGPSPGADQQPR